MADLVFLTDISQVGWGTKKVGARLADTCLVTGDITVATELERRGIPFIDEWRYLSGSDMACNSEIANDLVAHWWDERLADTVYHGFSLAEAAREDLFLPILLCLNACTAYTRLLASMPVGRIHVPFLPPTAICRNVPVPGFRAATSLAQAELRWLADQAGIAVSDPGLSCSLSPEGRRWIARRLPEPLPLIVSQGGMQDRVVLMLPTGLRPPEQAALEKRWAHELGWRVVRSYTWELKPGGTLDRVWCQAEIDQKLDKAWKTYETSLGTYAGPHPEIFRNLSLRFQFARIWAEMRAAARLGESFATLLDTLRPSLMVLGYDGFTVERVLVRIARQRGVPTAAFIHPGLRPTSGYRRIAGEADYIMVWGEEDIRGLTKFGVDRARIRPVGSARYDERYRCAARTSGESDRRHAQVTARQSLKLPVGSPVIVLLTANIYLGLSSIADPIIHRDTWRELVTLASRRPDLTFAIKPHPSYDHYEFYRHLCRFGPRNLVLLENVILEQALAASDVAVLVNYCTTAALEAMLDGIPVAFLRTGIYPKCQDDPLGERGAVSVRSVPELEAAIGRLLQDGGFRSSVLAGAEGALTTVLGERGPPVMDRLMTAFDNIPLPPATMRSDEASNPEDQVEFQLAVAARMLVVGGQQAEFLAAWKRLVDLLATVAQPAALAERTLFGITHVIGATSVDAAEVRRLVQKCLAELEGKLLVSPETMRKTLVEAYLTAMIRHVNTWHWNVARALAWQLLRELPDQAVRSGVFWRFFARSVVGSNRLALSLVNIVGNYSRLPAFKPEKTV